MVTREHLFQTGKTGGVVPDVEGVPIQDISFFVQKTDLIPVFGDVDANVVHRVAPTFQ